MQDYQTVMLKSTPKGNIYAKITKIFFFSVVSMATMALCVPVKQQKGMVFMRDESETYSYQGRVFSSRADMESFIADRAPVDVAAVPVARASGGGWGLALAVVAALFLTMCGFMVQSQKPDAQPVGSAGQAPGAVLLDDEITQKAALLINANAELCARVTAITKLQGDVYSVSCVRYRDGTGFATYEMNAATGSVR